MVPSWLPKCFPSLKTSPQKLPLTLNEPMTEPTSNGMSSNLGMSWPWVRTYLDAYYIIAIYSRLRQGRSLRAVHGAEFLRVQGLV